MTLRKLPICTAGVVAITTLLTVLQLWAIPTRVDCGQRRRSLGGRRGTPRRGVCMVVVTCRAAVGPALSLSKPARPGNATLQPGVGNDAAGIRRTRPARILCAVRGDRHLAGTAARRNRIGIDPAHCPLVVMCAAVCREDWSAIGPRFVDPPRSSTCPRRPASP